MFRRPASSPTKPKWFLPTAARCSWQNIPPDVNAAFKILQAYDKNQPFREKTEVKSTSIERYLSYGGNWVTV